MLTLPLIYAIDNTSRTGRIRLKSLVRKKKKNVKVLNEINDIIYNSGGFEYANQKLDEFSDKAADSISSYAESEIKKSLINLVIFNKERTR